MIAGIIKGLHYKGPAVFNLYTPCPVEHGLADELSPHAARLALESRAFPFMVYDPTAGDSWAECVDLNGNPEIEEDWPTYELRYKDADGAEQLLELPLTIADWAATENRFKKHFKKIKRDDWNDDQLPFHEFVKLGLEDRVGKTPFINLLGSDGNLDRMACSIEMVALAEDRLLFWDQLRELAGYKVAPAVRDQIAYQLEDDFEVKAAAIRAEYEGKIAELKATYPQIIARRLAEGLIRSSSGGSGHGRRHPLPGGVHAGAFSHHPDAGGRGVWFRLLPGRLLRQLVRPLRHPQRRGCWSSGCGSGG